MVSDAIKTPACEAAFPGSFPGVVRLRKNLIRPFQLTACLADAGMQECTVPKTFPYHLIHFGTDGMPQSNPAQRAFPLGKIGATLPRPLPAANNDAPHENSLRAFLQEEESDFEGRKPVPPENYTNHRVEFLNHKMLTWIEKPAAIGNRGRRR